MPRATILSLLLLLLPVAGQASPVPYALDLKATQVGFTWYLGPDPVKGTMPVSAATVTLDFAQPAKSHFTVALAASEAKAGFVFATQALQGRKMLDTASFPTITFEAERITRNGPDIHAEGKVTIRGVTKPLAMTARFYRPNDQKPGDLSHLIVLLDGQIDRNAFGVSGWPDAVGPRIDLSIRAVLDRSG